MEPLGSEWMAFHEISYFSIFPKYVEKIHVLLQHNKKKTNIHLLYQIQFFSKWGMFLRKDQNTRFMSIFLKTVPFMK
jgi:hypothetical protein